MKNSLFYCLLLSLSAATALQAQGPASTNWKENAGSTAWETATNWNNGVPLQNSAAYVAFNQAVISSAVTSIKSLYVGGASLSELTIATGGSLTVTGSSLVRISQSSTSSQIGLLTIAGGTLNATGRIYLGVNNGSNATLVVSDGGTLNTTGVVGLSNQTGENSNQTATLVIGGLTTAAQAGWINATQISASGADNTNTLIFNHTNERYTLLKGASSSEALNITGALQVQLKAGTTVLTGANTYERGTLIQSGATLLANTADAAQSATGTGTVTVNAGGTLGGIGYIGGAAAISGTLKPGDDADGAASASYEALKFKDHLTLLGSSTSEFTLNGLSRGDGYSAADVTGDLALGGTLKIVLGPDIALVEDASFQLFNVTGEITGSYASFDLPETWQGLSLTWDTQKLSTLGTLSVHVQPIPEPSHFITALGFGAAFLLLRRRRATA
ncbi:MAG TPA: hypothetical protein VNQ90_04000 [Chthoniobacteraceae bacterium]|nr:hypothetical protein [Chthoniobacteraceae bacterium]